MESKYKQLMYNDEIMYIRIPIPIADRAIILRIIAILHHKS